MSFSKYITLLSLLILTLSIWCPMVHGDIAECRLDTHCETRDGECCARLIVKDSVGNFIDNHFCLKKEIIESLGNKYYYQGIQGKAYCDYSILRNGIGISSLIIAMMLTIGIL